MVKLQKPTPKSLNKKEGMKKKPKFTKVEKPNKVKPSKIQESKQSPPAKSQKKWGKKKLFIENVQEAEVVVPVKSEKVGVDKRQKPAKKPLIIAPPESPAPTAKVAKGQKKAPDNKPQKKEKKPKTNEAPVIKGKKGAAAPKPNQPKQEQKTGKGKQKVKPVKSALMGPKTKTQVKKDNKLTFKKKEHEKRKLGEKTEKKKLSVKTKFEPIPFDEEKFNEIVTLPNIKKVGKALKELVESEVAKKKTSIFSDYKYLLSVGCYKIPNCPKRVVKLNLKHSLVDKDDDVVVIVPDLQRGAKVDYDPTIQHYEDLFREAGVEGLKIMPFNQLRTECNTFEAVRKFSNTYDYFMCDGRLVAHAAGFCGKVFQKPRTTIHAVRLNNPVTLKSEIEKSLNRTAFRQLLKGDLITIPVGTHKHTIQQLAENVQHVVEQLKTLYPGGLGNIRNMNLKIDITGTSSLPIFMSMAQPPEQTPYVVGPREEHMLKLRKKANDVLSKFALTKDAEIVRLSKKQLERKRKLDEAREVLEAKKKALPDDGSKPAKKARKENTNKSSVAEKEDESEKIEEEEKEEKEIDTDSDKEEKGEHAVEDTDDDEEENDDDDEEDGEDDDEEDDEDDDEDEDSEA